tara:strand:+ start:289 stop:774 length:486 start_codon:yes stop_codon:yes gene_type:complete
MARKFFSGQISKHQILDSFPDYESDFKMRQLYKRILEKPKRGWFFGVSKEKYQKFITDTYEIIEDLETGKLRFKTMKRLFQELWRQSDNCSEPITNIWYPIQEVAKSTMNSREEIRRYLSFLVDKKYIKRISDEPLLYGFTESGKGIKTDSEIENVIKNVA